MFHVPVMYQLKGNKRFGEVYKEHYPQTVNSSFSHFSSKNDTLSKDACTGHFFSSVRIPNKYQFALVLIAFLFLTGCTKEVTKYLEAPAAKPSADPAKPTVLLIMGQSNATNWEVEALKVFYTQYPQIYVVNCSVGSTMISQWVPGQYYYKTCIEQLADRTPDLMFFWQGENDTSNPTYMTESWGSQFGQIVDDLQAKYHQIKIVYAQLGQNNSGVGKQDWETVQNQQADYYNPRVRMVVTKDLQTAGDGIHMTTQSYHTIAERALIAFNEIL